MDFAAALFGGIAAVALVAILIYFCCKHCDCDSPTTTVVHHATPYGSYPYNNYGPPPPPGPMPPPGPVIYESYPNTTSNFALGFATGAATGAMVSHVPPVFGGCHYDAPVHETVINEYNVHVDNTSYHPSSGNDCYTGGDYGGGGTTDCYDTVGNDCYGDSGGDWGGDSGGGCYDD